MRAKVLSPHFVFHFIWINLLEKSGNAPNFIQNIFLPALSITFTGNLITGNSYQISMFKKLRISCLLYLLFIPFEHVDPQEPSLYLVINLPSADLFLGLLLIQSNLLQLLTIKIRMKLIIPALCLVGLGLSQNLNLDCRIDQGGSSYIFDSNGGFGDVRYYVSGLPQGAVFDGNRVSISPSTRNGSHNFRVVAVDEVGQSVDQFITLQISGGQVVSASLSNSNGGSSSSSVSTGSSSASSSSSSSATSSNLKRAYQNGNDANNRVSFAKQNIGGNNPPGAALGAVRNDGNGPSRRFRINSWGNYLSIAYGAGVSPAFTGSVTELFPFNFSSKVSGNLAVGTIVTNGSQKTVCGSNTQNLNNRVASGVVTAVRDDSFDITTKDGQNFRVNVAPCTLLNANTPGYSVGTGDQAVVKGTESSNRVITARQVTCLNTA